MAHENNHHHEHAPTAKRALHRDWRTWVIVGLMLAAMFAYVMSDDESLQVGGGSPKPTAPATAAP
ncbi:MAG: hypothetical protein ABFC77_11690 [Thermoguttaceae bacterium]